MATDKNAGTKPFPGSPTGNQSGTGRPDPGTKATQKASDKPTTPYPGSPTGNASGVGEGSKEKP